MQGKIELGQLVTVQPIGDRPLQKGDIVLCKANRSQYLYLIKAILGERYQIGNNIGKVKGGVTRNSIYGFSVDISA